MLVDGGVDVAVAQAGPLLAAGLAAEGFVAAAVGDVAEFLDVDVDEFTGTFAFVATYDASGRPVEMGRPMR